MTALLRPVGSLPSPQPLPGRVRTVAVIPARGGSKGIPGKNLRLVGGFALVERAARACRAAAEVDAVFVSTDDRGIAAAAVRGGAEVIWRPAALAGDEAGSESALLHALDQLAVREISPQTLLFVQCTSPFLHPGSLDEAVTVVGQRRADTAFSAVPSHRFLWRPHTSTGDPGLVTGQNHDPEVRQRRQDRPPEYLETGGFYAMDVAGFRRHRRRFFGRTRIVEVPELTALEIDSPADLALANALVPLLDPTNGRGPDPVDAGADPLLVDVVITDFDGVHTDDTVMVDAGGTESVRVSRSDGLGVERLRRAGVPLLIVSKETNPVVTARARKLGVEVLQAVEDKAAVVADWLAARNLAPARAAYLGNDLNDLAVMAAVGWPVAVADARPEVRRQARLVLSRRGGHGAVRELCDLVLAALPGAGANGTPQPVRQPLLSGA